MRSVRLVDFEQALPQIVQSNTSSSLSPSFPLLLEPANQLSPPSPEGSSRLRLGPTIGKPDLLTFLAIGDIGALMNRVHQPRPLVVLGLNVWMGTAAGADELVEIPMGAERPHRIKAHPLHLPTSLEQKRS